MDPRVHGMEISPGMELAANDTLDCCDDEMTAKPDSDGATVHTCGTCGTTVRVSALGLVADIG
ncbi:hypothetical protein [Streptomyces tubercidicus]|uniref:hypothetical protein n=1 Tax=Streptomyces tubercidicus TaxID=47759 RepID=UPI0034674971